MKSAEYTEWARHLNKRIMAELKEKGHKQIDVCSHRLMMTSPVKLYVVVIVDCSIYSISGHNENELIKSLIEKIELEKNATGRELIYQY